MTGPGCAAGGSAGPGDNPPADDGRVRFGEFVADEVSLDLRLSWRAAADRISYACDLAGRLPVTFAALGGGLIDPVHAKIIAEQTDILSAADAAEADPVLAAAAQSKTYGELRATAARLVLRLDPGTLRELRCRAYLDLLQERDSRDALPGPEPKPGPGRAVRSGARRERRDG